MSALTDPWGLPVESPDERSLRLAAEGDDARATAATHELDEYFPVLDWHELWAEVPDEVEWICEPLLEKGRSAAIYSPPKAGKSLLSLEIAAALAAGRPVLGNRAQERLTVLYVDLENTRADLKERLQALGYGPADLARLRYLSFPTLAALDSAAGGDQLRDLVERHDAAVVVIDTLSRVIAGEENDADTFSKLYRHALVPLKARGTTVLRLDHSGKDTDRGMRGSSAKSADVDHVWRLTHHGNGRLTLHREATRTGHGADHLNLERHYEPLRHLPAGIQLLDPRIEAVITALDDADAPANLGREKARPLLNHAGVRASNEVIRQAINLRKERADLSRDSQDRSTQPTLNTPVPDKCTDDDVTAGQTCPGQVRDRSGQGFPGEQADLSPVPPPLGGDRFSTPAPDTDYAAEGRRLMKLHGSTHA